MQTPDPTPAPNVRVDPSTGKALTFALAAAFLGATPPTPRGVAGPPRNLRPAGPPTKYRARRNDYCPCGSGRKFKTCCIRKTATD